MTNIVDGLVCDDLVIDHLGCLHEHLHLCRLSCPLNLSYCHYLTWLPAFWLVYHHVSFVFT